MGSKVSKMKQFILEDNGIYSFKKKMSRELTEWLKHLMSRIST